MEDYEKARTGLSPPAGYLYKPWGRIAFKRGHQPRHHAYANEHHSSLAQGHPCLSGALVLERPIKEDETKPYTTSIFMQITQDIHNSQEGSYTQQGHTNQSTE